MISSTQSSVLAIRQLGRLQFRALITDSPAILLIHDGKKCVERNGRRFELTPGWVGLLDAGLPYTVENRSPPGRAYFATALLVSPDTLESLHREERRRSDPYRTTNDDRVLASCERAVLAVSDALLPVRLKENAVREALLWLSEAGIGFSEQRPSFADQLRRLIAADPDFNWTAANAGRALAVSEATLRRRLAHLGAGFQEVLADVRMTHALGLLQTTTLPMNRIALEVGYSSPSRFAVRFRARFGVRPSEVRGTQDDLVSI